MPIRLRLIDRQFARFCRTGDMQALGAVFDQAVGELLHLAGWLVGNRGDAEDLLQQTFLTAIDQRASFAAERRVLPWLVTILTNHARNLRRERARRDKLPPQRDQTKDPIAQVADAEFATWLTHARSELRSPYREVLELHLEQGLSSKEIAARLQRPAGTVRTQLARALEVLRRGIPSGFAAALVPCTVASAVHSAAIAKVKAKVASMPVVVGKVPVATGGILMANKLLVVLPVLAVLLGVGVYLATPEVPTPVGEQSLAGFSAPAAPAGTSPPTGASSPVRIPAPPAAERPGVYRIVDEQGVPVPKAGAYLANAKARQIQGPALAVANADGRLQVLDAEHTGPDQILVFHAAGFRPATTRGVRGGAVVLSRGESLVGRAIDRVGRPVAGLWVLASRTSFLTSTDPDGPRTTIPGPGADAVYAACSDRDGRFAIYGLQAAKYCLELQHETLAVVDAGIEKDGRIALPHAPLTVQLDDVYCASVEVDGANIATLNMQYPDWTAKGASAARSVEYVVRRHGGKSGWKQNGATFYMIPGKDGAPMDAAARFTLFFAEPPRLVVDVPLRPMQDGYVHQVRVSPGGQAVAAVDVGLADASGKSLRGLPVILSRSVEVPDGPPVSESYQAMDGAALQLPAGVYELSLRQPLLQQYATPKQVVLAGGSQRLDVSIAKPLYATRILCTDFVSGDCHVTVAGEGTGQWASQFVRDGEAPLFWLPSGLYTVSVNRPGCRQGVVAFVVTAPDAEASIVVPALLLDD